MVLAGTFYKLTTLAMGEISLILHVPASEGDKAMALLPWKDHAVEITVRRRG